MMRNGSQLALVFAAMLYLHPAALADALDATLQQVAATIRAEEAQLIELAHTMRQLQAEEQARTQALAPRLAEAERLLKTFLAAPTAVPFWLHELANLAEGAAITSNAIGQIRPLLAHLQAEQEAAQQLQQATQQQTRDVLAKRGQLAQAYGQLQTMLAKRLVKRGTQASQQGQNTDAIPSLEALLASLAVANSATAADKRHDGPRLVAPVAGMTVARYGKHEVFGGKHAGLQWQGLKGGLMTAPAAGEVLYAGDFLNYQQVLILDAGSGYHILLTGLESLTVGKGMAVQPGMPVGWLGEKATAYMELRRLGQPIDPEPFMHPPHLDGAAGEPHS